MNCPICGAELDNEANECFLCGYKFSNNEQSNNSLISEENTSNIATESDDISKSKVPIIIIIVIVILLLAGLVVYYFMKGKENNTSTALSTTISTSSSVQTETTTEAITTTTSETTTITTTTTTTTANKEVCASDLIKVSKGKLLKKYFNNAFDADYVSIGQQNVVSLENTSSFPYYKFAFMYMSADEIPNNEITCGIHVLPGGKIDEKTTIGMTYNELKEIYGFDGASLDGGTFGYTAWIKVDGVKWGIEFKLNTDDKAKLGNPELGESVDLSAINPKSDLGYYIESIQ